MQACLPWISCHSGRAVLDWMPGLGSNPQPAALIWHDCRDLKSPNLLVDSHWNVKVRRRCHRKRCYGAGSVHDALAGQALGWMATEAGRHHQKSLLKAGTRLPSLACALVQISDFNLSKARSRGPDGEGCVHCASGLRSLRGGREWQHLGGCGAMRGTADMQQRSRLLHHVLHARVLGHSLLAAEKSSIDPSLMQILEETVMLSSAQATNPRCWAAPGCVLGPPRSSSGCKAGPSVYCKSIPPVLCCQRCPCNSNVSAHVLLRVPQVAGARGPGGRAGHAGLRRLLLWHGPLGKGLSRSCPCPLPPKRADVPPPVPPDLQQSA